MGLNQGLIRLQGGVTRYLNKTEKKRQLLFVTRDQAIGSILEGNFNILVNGKVSKVDATLDTYGRVIGASGVIKKIGDNEFSMRVNKGNLIIDTLQTSKI